ncbi:hypothetical protein BH10ACT11_BH10ACT11_02330 [soil metagenome]
MKKAGIITLALVAAMAVAVPALGSGASKPSKVKTAATVKVGDDFYSKTSVKFTVPKKGKKVKFKWLPANTDSHNVILTKGPRSLTNKQKKSFKSATGAIGVRFQPTFKKQGPYDFVCTIHPTQMKLTVKVK